MSTTENSDSVYIHIVKFFDKNIILIFDNIDTTNKSFEEVINECRFNKDFKKLIIKSQFNFNTFGKDYIHKKYFNEFINVSEVYFEIIKYMINNINFDNNISKFINNITLRYDYPLKELRLLNCICDYFLHQHELRIFQKFYCLVKFFLYQEVWFCFPQEV